MHTDVVVIGGGPAGSAAALSLARAGIRVSVLERTRFDTTRVGEFISPEIAASLHWMDAWEPFVGDGHLPVRGLLSVWGTGGPGVNDLIFSPYGRGWMVDRARFDRLLLDRAARSGATTFMGARARGCSRADGRWTVDATIEGRAELIRAKYVIDAVGRMRAARHDNRQRLDRLVAYVCYMRRERGDTDHSWAVIEAIEDGWWFSAQLPHDLLMLMFHTDADLRPRGCGRLAHFWERLERTTVTRARLPRSPVPHRLFCSAADSQWRPATEANRVAIGDALLSMDPLCGQGVQAAIHSGRRAAEAIVAQERGDTMALVRLAAIERQRLAAYLRDRTTYYTLEKRWPTAPFWSRRAAAHFHESEAGECALRS